MSVWVGHSRPTKSVTIRTSLDSCKEGRTLAKGWVARTLDYREGAALTSTLYRATRK